MNAVIFRIERRIALPVGLALIVLLSFSHNARAQWNLQPGEIDQQIHRGIDVIYNMDFSAAEKIFDSVITEHPEHPAGYFFRADVMFWRAITNPDNTTYDAEYKQWLQKAEDRADAMLEKNPKDIAGLFYKGVSIGMRARLYEYRATADMLDLVMLIVRDAKAGVQYLNELEDIIPDNPDILFGRGLNNYYVEAEKEAHPTLAPIISAAFPTGNKAMGLQMLEISAAHAAYASVEAKFELIHIYYVYEKNYARAYQLAQELASRYPNNVIFLHYLGFAAYTENNVAQYDSMYRVMLDRAKQHRDGYTIKQAREAMFFIGAAQIKKANGNMDTALYYLYNSDLLSRKVNGDGPQDWWVTDAELYMGQAYDVRGNRKEALEMYNRVLNLPDHNRDHADAERYIQNPYKR